MKIQILNKQEIDISKWNNAIRDSINNDIFGYSWYLDIVSENWFGIVVDNYKKVMPLPYSNGLFFRKLAQSNFIPYLNLYSTEDLKNNEIKTILEVLKKTVFYYSIKIGRYNKNDLGVKKFFPALTLFDNYTEILNLYYIFLEQSNKNLKNYKVYVGLSPISVKNFILQNKLPYSKKDLNTLVKLISEAILKNFGVIISVYNHKDILVAFGFFLLSKKEVHFLIWENIDDTSYPLFLVLDSFFKKNVNAEKTLTFNFNHRDLSLVTENLNLTKVGYYEIYNSKIKKLHKFLGR